MEHILDPGSTGNLTALVAVHILVVKSMLGNGKTAECMVRSTKKFIYFNSIRLIHISDLRTQEKEHTYIRTEVFLRETTQMANDMEWVRYSIISSASTIFFLSTTCFTLCRCLSSAGW